MRTSTLPPVEVHARVRRVLSREGAEAPRLLLVDHTQRLDPASATLVHQVVVDQVRRTVATVRSAEPVTGAIAGLWTDGQSRSNPKD
jgi:hypothetical protein